MTDESKFTLAERFIIEALGDLYDRFCALDAQHPTHKREFMDAIHAAQRIVMIRPAVRTHNWIKIPAPPVDAGTAVGTLKVEVDPQLKAKAKAVGEMIVREKPAVKAQPDEDDTSPSDKLLAARQAKLAVMDTPVYLDFETTDKDPKVAEIVQVGIVNSGGQVLMNTLVNPKTPLTEPTFTGITPEQVETAPRLADIVHHLLRLLNKRVVVIYNADHDWTVLKNDLERNGLISRMEPLSVVCAMKLFAQYNGEVNPRFGTYTWKSLSFAMEALGKSWDGLGTAHDAVSDCKATELVMKGMADFADLPF